MIIEKKDDLYRLIDKFERSSLTELELELGENFKLKLLRRSDKCAKLIPPSHAHRDARTNSMNDESAVRAVDEYADKPDYIKSPLIGTFYSSPAPDADPYVTEGDKVKKGAVLCIVEAMKVMNEVDAEFDCEIIEVLAENGQVTEYGQPLFKVKKL